MKSTDTQNVAKGHRSIAELKESHMEVVSPENLDLAVQAVEAGELVVLPTQRWYMICANASDRSACEQIFAGKGRARSKSLAYVLPDAAVAEDLFVMTPYAKQLASAFWPGDLAMILPWSDMGVGRRHEAVGMPNALVTLDPGPLGDLARRSEVPIAATTANLSDATSTGSPGPAITTIGVRYFVAESGLNISYCIDGGVCPLANHLTIVDCTGTDSKVVRSGVVHERAVNAVLFGTE